MNSKTTNSKYKKNTYSKEIATNPGEYLIDNLSTLKEYLNTKPNLLVSIECCEEQKNELMQSYAEKVKSDIFKIQDTTKITAIVRHQTIRLRDFFHNKSKPEVILALDHVTDPHNLGAIVRSAAFFGIKHVLVSNRRQVLLSDLIVNISRGGLAHTSLMVEPNLSQALTKLKTAGYWIVGAEMGGEDISAKHADLKPCVLVLGSEHSGLSDLIQKKCDTLVRIPAKSSLDSLNVSVSAAILCAAWNGLLAS